MNTRRRPLAAVLAAPVLLVAVASGLAACNKPTTPTATTSTPTATASASGTATPTTPASTTSAPQLIEFRTDGAGPYLLGDKLTTLQQREPGLDEVGPMADCPGNTQARGVGTWRDVQLFFHADGRLYLLINRSLSIPTPSGAYLGTTLDDKGSQKGLRTIYGGLVTFELPPGNPTAFLVQTINGGGILFELNQNHEVTAMYAAQANYLRTTYPTGKLC